MRKKMYNFWGIIAIALIGFGIIACGSDSPSEINNNIYTGTDRQGNKYTLTIIPAGSKSVITADDEYELVVVSSSGISILTNTGNIDKVIQSSLGNTYSLSNAPDAEIILNGGTISSITGEIPMNGGGTFTVRTFDTIYFRANRWTDEVNGAYGEGWSTGNSILLSDIYNGNFTDFIDTKAGLGGCNKIIISGTASERIQFCSIDIHHVADDGTYTWLAGGMQRKFTDILLGNFSKKIIYIQGNNSIDINTFIKDNPGEVTVSIGNCFSYLLNSNPDNLRTWDSGTRLPAAVENGAITATIKSLTIEPYDGNPGTIELGNYDADNGPDKMLDELQFQWSDIKNEKFKYIVVKFNLAQNEKISGINLALPGDGNDWDVEELTTGDWTDAPASANTTGSTIYMVVDITKFDGYSAFITGTQGSVHVWWGLDQLISNTFYITDKAIVRPEDAVTSTGSSHIYFTAANVLN